MNNVQKNCGSGEGGHPLYSISISIMTLTEQSSCIFSFAEDSWASSLDILPSVKLVSDDFEGERLDHKYLARPKQVTLTINFTLIKIVVLDSIAVSVFVAIWVEFDKYRI